MDMAHKMKFSIVTPSYNQARYLNDTMCSVLAQRGVQLEYIVMDGGSKDGSVAIIESHAKRLAYWRSAKDGGQTAAINEGLQRCQGDVVAWLNSDDLYLPDALSRVAKAFEGDPEIGLVYGHCLFIDADNRVFRRCLATKYNPPLTPSDYPCIPQQSAFWRRELLTRCGVLDDSLKFCMDMEYWWRLSRSGVRMKFLDEFLSAYRWHEEAKGATILDVRDREFRKITQAMEGRQPSAWRIIKQRVAHYWGIRGHLHDRAVRPPQLVGPYVGQPWPIQPTD